MDAAQSEKARAGRVTMPKVFLVVGSVEFAVMIALTFFSLLSAHLPAFAVIFGVFSLAGLALVIVYLISAYIIPMKCLSIKIFRHQARLPI